MLLHATKYQTFKSNFKYIAWTQKENKPRKKTLEFTNRFSSLCILFQREGTVTHQILTLKIVYKKTKITYNCTTHYNYH